MRQQLPKLDHEDKILSLEASFSPILWGAEGLRPSAGSRARRPGVEIKEKYV
ncbi:MAG: hypothetical protein HWD61_10705 [Parachlamydiaceae bacterium]|nr:MAG: hypothetical protein HWD61_10705 [Parachlamydiaceae bacterium]